MSNQINDINNEALLDTLRENNGAWYRNAETLEEAVEKSVKANRIGSSRLGMARAFHYTEIAPNIFVKNADTLDSKNESVAHVVEPSIPQEVIDNAETPPVEGMESRQIGTLADDTSDEDYQQEVDNKLSHGEY